MEPAWTQFESTYQSKTYIVTINVDEKDTPEFKQYSGLLGDGIPLTVWLNKEGKTVGSQLGSASYDTLKSETEKALSP